MTITPYERSIIQKQLDVLRPAWEAYNVLSDLMKKSRTTPDTDNIDEIAAENIDVHVPSWKAVQT